MLQKVLSALTNLFSIRKEGKNMSYSMGAHPPEKFRQTDYFIVIMPDEIEDIEPPEFGQHGKLPEEGYVEMLKRAQPLIEEYKKNHYIQPLVFNSFSDIEEKRDEKVFRDNFDDGFFGVCRIWAEKTSSGKYRIITNGKHRAFIAKKYGFNLIVNVVNEAIYSPINS